MQDRGFESGDALSTIPNEFNYEKYDFVEHTTHISTATLETNLNKTKIKEHFL